MLAVDEVGNKRQTWTDAFGRVIETDEPNASGTLNVSTCYAYDLNNNLIGILQPGSESTCTLNSVTYNRCLTYDKLSRPTSKTEPETKENTTYFYYTTSGGSLCSGDTTEICRRTDANSVTTTYTYDSMNRLTQKSYSDSTPTVTYSYDSTSCLSLLVSCYNLGRRTGMSDGSGSTAWAYDAVGNILRESRTINSVNKTITYTYNLDGTIASIVYPGGRTLTYTPGNAERNTAAQDNGSSINYATSGHYTPYGAIASVQNGANLVLTFFPNNRLQPCRVSVMSSGTAPAACADFSNTGNVLDLSFSYSQGGYNNGNTATLTNNITSGRTQTYTYDPLNRLLTAQSSATMGRDCWGQEFGNNATPPTLADDVLGNPLVATTTQCSSPAPNWAVNGYNQISSPSGYTYTNAGEVTYDNLNSYTYDAENHVITTTVSGPVTYCYTYDGNGLRVQKAQAQSGYTCTTTGTYAPSVYELYWRDTGGNTIAETDGSGSTSDSSYNEYVFFGGARIAQSNPNSGNVYYYFGDQLGNTRVVTNASGTPCYEADFLPYGEENTPASFSNTCSTRYKFTGYERDPETLNDYAFNRYYSYSMERFLSPDPMYGDISDPQTINKYAYVRNNPVNLTDPAGLCDGDLGQDVGGDCDGPPCDFSCSPDPGPGPPPDIPAPPPPLPEAPVVNDPFTVGCETDGMPCGMQFPVPGGMGAPNCPFGSGSCGGMIYGLVNIQGSPAQTEMDPLGNFMIALTVWDFAPREDHPKDRVIGPLVNVIYNNPVIHALDSTAIMGMAFVGAGVNYLAGGAAFVGGCFEPTFFEPLTCTAGSLGLGAGVAGGTILGKFGTRYLFEQVIPAWQEVF
jgi:RHS repeat-associated protein